MALVKFTLGRSSSGGDSVGVVVMVAEVKLVTVVGC